MTNTRRIILHWAEQGHIAVSDLPRALALAEVLPSRDAWGHFLDRLLLWMGTVLVASGLIFFLAYNWQGLGRFAKFSLVEAIVVAALLFIWRLGLDRPGGKAALLGACLFLGALLALIGQTYQTGADTFELFGAWAAMILPWVLVGRSTVLWLLWLTLVNLAITLYFQAFPSVFGLLFNTERVLWVLFAFNTVALAVWEAVAARGIAWLGRRWEPRLLATASGGFVTALAMTQILEARDASLWAILAWLAWLAAAWAVYRRPVKDVFVLAGGVLSVIVVAATFFAKHLCHGNAAGFLVVGLIVIALSAAGGWWLKNVAAEGER
jgi:uncharacterized membrane protein